MNKKAWRKLIKDYTNKDNCDFMKKHKLTIHNMNVFCMCANEYEKAGSTRTCISDVAKLFEYFGFDVAFEDGNRINYAIT